VVWVDTEFFTVRAYGDTEAARQVRMRVCVGLTSQGWVGQGVFRTVCVYVLLAEVCWKMEAATQTWRSSEGVAQCCLAVFCSYTAAPLLPLNPCGLSVTHTPPHTRHTPTHTR
jgi:hypothetical protein